MPTLSEIREQYPQYKSWPDDKLAAGLKRKGIQIDPEPAAMPGRKPQIEMTSPRGNTGTLDADDPRIPTLIEQYGWMPKNPADLAKAGWTGLRKGAMSFISGPTDIGTWLGGKLDTGLRALGVQPTPEQEAYAVQSRAGAEAQGTEATQKRMEELTGPYHQAGSRLENIMETGGEIASNALAPGGALRRTAMVAVPALASEGAGYATEGTAVEPAARVAGLLTGGIGAARFGAAPKGGKVPTTEQLKRQAGVQYEIAERTGKVITAQQYDAIVQRVLQKAAAEGINPEIHGPAFAALKVLLGQRGLAKTEKGMDMLRRTIAGASGSPDSQIRRMAHLLRNEFDAGYIQYAPSELAEARRLTRRYKQGERMDRAQERAEVGAGQYSQAGFENAMRTEMRQMARKEIDIPRFDPHVKSAVTTAAKGTPLQNFARGVGKNAPTGVMPIFGGIGSGSALGTAAGTALGPLAGTIVGGGLTAALWGAGAVGKMVASALERGSFKEAERAARSDPRVYQLLLRAREEARLAANLRSGAAAVNATVQDPMPGLLSP